MANEIVPYEVPALDADLEIDFLDTDDLETLEEGIRKIATTSDLLALVQGVAIVRVEREELWRQAGFETLKAYRAAQLERLGMPKQTVSLRRKVAEGWLDNRKLIGKFNLVGHVTKLALLNDALRIMKDKRLVMEHFKKDSFRDFAAWINPRLPAPDLPDVAMSISDGTVALDGVDCLTFADDLPDEERDFVSKLLRDGYKARRGACLAHVVAVYDSGEARAIERFLKELRAKK